MLTISVVIPALNEETVLPQTLAHAAKLGFDEVVVVDGGSRDRTTELLAPYLSARAPFPITLITAPPGRASQMNLGAAASRGEVLLFLHADTLLPAEAKAEILAALNDPACVGGRFDVRFERDSGWGWVISRMMNLRSRLSGIATGDQAIFVRRAAFERLGGFADLPLMEDVDFSRRLKRIGPVAPLRAKVVTSYRRWERSGPVRTILLMWTLRFLYWLGVSPRTLSRFYGIVR
ncbi:MAG: TIGR04283 family arsenosugar biosynthesis glycosyltransferase [Nitrospirota bacterium]